jgi:hypothetical protein
MVLLTFTLFFWLCAAFSLNLYPISALVKILYFTSNKNLLGFFIKFLNSDLHCDQYVYAMLILYESYLTL